MIHQLMKFALNYSRSSGFFFILIIWGISYVVSNVSGSFPLNDDFAYARMVKTLLDTGKLEITGWTSMPLVVQIYWGYAWCLVTGFSFEVLRLSTLFLSAACLTALYFVIKKFTSDPKVPLLILLTMAFNPLYYLLSASFMTDVPFFAFFMISLYFFIKYFEEKELSWLILAFITALLSVFIRQIGIVLMVSFAVTWLFMGEKSLIKNALPFLTAGFTILLLYIFQLTANTQTESPLLDNTRTMKLFLNLNSSNLFGITWFIKNLFFALIYIGLFISPFLLYSINPILGYLSKNNKTLLTVIILLLPLIIVLYLSEAGKLLPSRPNTLYHYGLGPALLRDVDILGMNHLNTIPSSVWMLLTYFGLTGAVIIVMVLSAAVYRSPRTRENISYIDLFLFFTTSLLLIITGLFDFYDRYIILFVPPVILLFVRITGAVSDSIPRLIKIISFASVVIIAVFSVLSTHDYFSWNRARWQALDDLTINSGIPSGKIDGGFEFNGWNSYSPGYKPSAGKSWWWVEDDKFVISFGNLPGYMVLRSYGYKSWLYNSKQKIYVLRKKE